MKPIKVAISGAAGQIGYALIFRIANGDMFGDNVPVELHLLEVEAALPALQGVAMELEDCAFPLLKNVVITSDVNVAMKEINWAVLVGAAPRKAGMERADLLKINGGIFKQQGQAINNFAAENVKVFVVGNPCNTNAYIAMCHAPEVPKENFYAMTMLDQNRAQQQLAIKAKVAVTEVTHINIWGNHSATQYPDFYQAKIQNKPVVEIIDKTWLENDFIPLIQKRGAEVIKARGASSAGSAANAAIDNVFALTHETPGNERFSVAKYSQGEYGIDKGLIFSFPCRVENGLVKVVQGIEHNAFAKEKIQLSLDELRGEVSAVKDLKLI